MRLEEAKQILNSNGYLLKEDAFRNNTDMSDICAIIDAHGWSPKLVVQQLEDYYYNIYLKHGDIEKLITVDEINKDNYKDYIGKFVNVRGKVNLYSLGLTELPIRFGKVGGYFDCSDNNLTSLEGSPENVGGYFSCSDNNLTSLEGSPEEVGRGFYCYKNQLTSLKGAPIEVGSHFYCNDNKVKFTEEDVREVSNVKGEILV